MGNEKRKLYCFCRRKEFGFMILCDKCYKWFHGKCCDVTKKQAEKLPFWYCIICCNLVKLEEYVSQVETNLKDSLAAVKADINRLKKENSELSTSQAELEEVKDLVKHLREENSDLKANCEKKTHEIENLLSQVSQLTEENLTLKSSCQRVREDEDLGRYFGEENLKLKADSEKIAQENKALLSQVNHLTEENLELKTNFQKVQESTDLVKQLREENFTMKEDSRKKAQEIKALVSEVEKL
ncbi:hypothetical protein FOCC_FOCC013754, partial [Frankliniella occidentalis]